MSFWFAAFMKLFADTLKTAPPLINKQLLSWLSSTYLSYHPAGVEAGEKSVGLGRDRIGVGAVGDAGGVEFVEESLYDRNYEDWVVIEDFGK